MARKANRTDIVLEAGQLWRTSNGYIEIVQLGKTLAHYRRTVKPNQRGVAVFLAPMKTMLEMLNTGEARLVETNP